MCQEECYAKKARRYYDLKRKVRSITQSNAKDSYSKHQAKESSHTRLLLRRHVPKCSKAYQIVSDKIILITLKV